MRVALISDLHANAVALRAVLDDIARMGVDQIVCLGDVATLGPRPSDVVETLEHLQCPCIQGNHDEFLTDPELIKGYSEAPVVVDSVDWCRARLSGDELDFLTRFRTTMEIPLSENSTLFLFHGTPRSHMEDLLATTPPDEVDIMLNGHTGTVMAGGHTHIQMLRQHRGSMIVNPGSVGAPFKEYVSGCAPTLMPHAEYAIVAGANGSVSVDLRRVAVDKHAMRKAVLDTDLPIGESLIKYYA
ncbi:MAG: metallophosphoesterase family protein [Pseudomonadales bacterium]